MLCKGVARSPSPRGTSSLPLARGVDSSRSSSPTTGRACPRKFSPKPSPRTSQQKLRAAAPASGSSRSSASPKDEVARSASRARRVAARWCASSSRACTQLGYPAVSSARRSRTRRHPMAAYFTSSTQRRLRRLRSRREYLEPCSAMQLMMPPGRLDRPVDHEMDHVLGPRDAEITLVEYGSYACPHCRAANERIAQARDQLGDRVCYAFRHRPLTDNSLSFRAAELAELARTPEAFWSAHIKLMTRSMQLTEDDLVAVAADLGVNVNFALGDSDAVRRARARVAVFYSGDINPGYLAAAAAGVGFFGLLGRGGGYGV